MKKILYLLIALITSSSAYSQEWQRLLMNGERDFKKIQKAFYDEWDGKVLEKGNGYKQFKRWEYKNAPRLIDGKIQNIANAYPVKLREDLRMAKSRTAETQTWEPLGPYSWENGTSGYNPGIGRVNSIDIHPTNSNILFAGTAGGGLWKSETGGNSWTTMSEDFPILGVTDFFIAPDDTDKMYVLTGDAYGADTYSYGVYKSTDGGATWANNSNFTPEVTDFNRMYRMIVDPTDSDVVLIAGNTGVWKSTDGAITWTQVNTTAFVDIEFKPGNSDVVYASTNGSTDFGLSIDGGDTWSTITTPLSGLGRTAIGVSADNPEYVYLLASTTGGAFGGVFRSTDSGETFTMQSNTPNVFNYSTTGEGTGGQGWYDLSIAVNPDDADDIYVSGVHIWNSTDGGVTWQDESDNYQILNYWVYNESDPGSYVHADNHTLDFLNGELFAGCDGGIWKSTNLGDSWQDLSEGLNNTQLYRLGLDPNDENVIIAGAQDNGSNILINGTWTHIFGADGMEALVDHTDGDIVYSTYQFGGLLRYTNKGEGGSQSIAGALDGTGAWVTPYMLDPADNNLLFAGYSNVWRYNVSGGTWTEISNFGSSSRLTSLKVAPTNSDYIYVSTGATTYRTLDGGTTWDNISSGLPSQTLTYITVSENDPNKIWATFSGYDSDNKVYVSEDAGSTWTNISDGLPNLPVNCIVHQRDSDDQLYVGTDVGVYQKNNSGDWEPWFDGLPNVIVNELEIHYATQKIVAATYGRGLWRNDILASGSVISITADQVEIVEGQSITFGATLADGVSDYDWTFEGGSPSTSTDASPVVTYEEAGKYDVTLLNANRTEMITVLDLVTIESISSDVQAIDIGQSVTFSANYDGNPTEWLWNFEGGTPSIAFDQNPTVTYDEVGEYDVRLRLKGDTEDDVTIDGYITVIEVLGLDDEKALVYPSVSQDKISLKIDESNTTVELITVSGELLKRFKADSDVSINIENLSEGVYLLKLSNSQKSKTVRFIKD
ncbi:VPS10 domain-containing protein [Ekhidna sp.]